MLEACYQKSMSLDLPVKQLGLMSYVLWKLGWMETLLIVK